MYGKHAAGQMKRAFDDEWACLKNTVVKPDLINLKKQMFSIDLAYQVMNRYIQGMGTFQPTPSMDKDQIKLLKEMNDEISKFKNITGYASFDLFHGERAKPVKIIDKHSRLDSMNDITTAIVRFIDASKHEILIQNPYVVLTPTAEAALKRASDRGVKIIIHSNSGESTDCVQPQAFLMNDWKRLLKDMPNLRLIVAKSANDRLHSKVFVFDQQITIIGSYNMDSLSEQIISECVACVHDRSFGLLTALRLRKDMEGALEYKIRIDENGNPQKVFGPEDHVPPEILKKMNFFRKLQWLRPLI
jgi:phosphatidylserine/phosphatidylglycerophosphate/cardiolipin synthase-like enzyme